MVKWIKIVFGVIITLIIVVVIYLCTGNLQAEQSVNEYLKSSDNVHINKIDDGYFFDGLGEKTAIVFYPGAKVEYISYAKLMYNIAEEGIDCFLIKMPFNMAILGYNKASNIIDNNNYDSWYMAGHSLGGVVCASYAADHPDKINGVIMLGSYPNKRLPDNMLFISAFGSEDRVLDEESYNESKKFFPKDALEFKIEGGNHSGFGNYGTQNGDGEAKITSDEQMEEIVKILNENIQK